MDSYNTEFNVELLYDYIDKYERINYIETKTIEDFLKQKLKLRNKEDFEIVKDSIFFYNDKSKNLIEKVRNSAKESKEDFLKLVRFLDKSEIRFVIKKNKMDFRKKDKIIYKNKKIYSFAEIEEQLETLDYKGLDKFILEIEEPQVVNDYRLHMQKAYAMYYIEEYYESYKEYKRISEKALKNKEFVIYALSEFNRYYIGVLIKNCWYLTEENIRIRIEKEIEKMDLDAILLKMPFETEQLDVLKRILTWKFVDSNTRELIDIKQKIDKEENKCYVGIDINNIGIYQFKNHIYSFWNFIKYNFLTIDLFKEVRGVFYNYIDSMLRNYTIPRVHIDEQDSLFGIAAENIKIETLEIFDIIVMIEYISTKDIDTMLQRYDITEMKLEDDGIEILEIIIKNCIDYIEEKGRRSEKIDINKILLILSRIRLNINQYKDINKYILEYMNKWNLDINNYRYINKYIYNQAEQYQNVDVETLTNILTKIFNSIQNSNSVYNDQINIIANIAYYLHRSDKNYMIRNKNIVMKLTSNTDNDIYKIITRIYDILDKEEKYKVKKLLKSKLNVDEFDKSHCEIYYYALMRNIIKPKLEYENRMEIAMQEVQSNNIIRVYEEAIDVFLGMVTNLILNNKIIEKKKFEKYLGIKDEYDFLFDIEVFPIEKIKVKWLYEYSENLLKTISENHKVKQAIKKEIEKNILDGEHIEKKLLRIYIEFFNNNQKFRRKSK